MEDSLSVNVMVAVWPALRDESLASMRTVGRTVSIVIEGERESATLGLPAASVNTPAAIATVPGAAELTVGVNVAE